MTTEELPHIFVISLLNTPTGQTRWKKLRHRLLIELRYPEDHITVFPAIHGKHMSYEEMRRVTTPLCSTMCTPSIVGCALSHMKIWEIIRMQTMPHAIILEDDVDLKDDFVSTIKKAIVNPPHPKYHVLLLGCFFCNDWIQKYFHGQEQDEKEKISKHRHQIQPDSDELELEWRNVKKFKGTHAYICSWEGANVLLGDVKGKIKYHIDVQMSWVLAKHAQMYALNHPVAYQSDWLNSSNSTHYGFPGIFNTILRSLPGPDHTNMGYILNVGISRIGSWEHHALLTPWHLILFLTGLFHWIRWEVFVGVVAIDSLVIPTDDKATKLLSYILGTFIRSLL
jgi:GR25 family glycosyltransferase involved in LPS biosynthesis